jgi:uncharacterized membrane protein YjjP (DUF1212 family)
MVDSDRVEATTAGEADVRRLLERLVDVLLTWSYEGTFHNEELVRSIAARYGHTDVQVTFLADAAVLTVGETTVSFARLPTVPALDQVSKLKRLLTSLDRDGLTARQALTRLDAITATPPRWSQPLQVLGLVLFAVGFGVSVQATWQEVGVSAVTGLLVGLLVVAGQHWPRLAVVSPFLASVLVSVVVLQLFRHGTLDGGPIQLIVPALFFFIPGDSITAAGLELSVGRMTAGASRLVYSMVMLLILAFGAVVAAALVGAPLHELYDVNVEGNLGFVAVWGGWVAFALGVMLTFQMATRDFPWALGMVLLTAATVELGVRAFGDPLGTFLGALVMTVVSFWLARPPDRPPAYVMYLGAFYVLTPGSHGLRGLESWIGGDRIQGVTSVATMFGLLVAVVIGILLGAALVRDSTTTI